MISQEELKEVLDYNKDTGIFRWKVIAGKRAYIGDIAGTTDSAGYIIIGYKNKLYKAHRLAWLYIYDKWPKKEIDHINRIKNDNSICNLRESTSKNNRRNTGNQKNNTSRVKGIGWHKKANKWHSRICINYKLKHLGYFNNFYDAVIARHKAEKKVNWSESEISPAEKYLRENNLLPVDK